MNDEYKNDEDKMLFEEIENRCRLNFGFGERCL